MIQDGQYIMSVYLSNGEKKQLGAFSIEGGEIIFPSQRDELTISLFPPGPISAYTKRQLSKILDGKDAYHHIEKVKESMQKSNQWSDEDLQKVDAQAEQKLYHIHQGPHRITDKPLTLKEVRERHGSVQRLENNGFRLIPHAQKPLK